MKKRQIPWVAWHAVGERSGRLLLVPWIVLLGLSSCNRETNRETGTPITDDIEIHLVSSEPGGRQVSLGGKIYYLGERMLSPDQIQDARLVPVPEFPDSIQIQAKLTDSGREQFTRTTGANVGKLFVASRDGRAFLVVPIHGVIDTPRIRIDARRADWEAAGQEHEVGPENSSP